MRAAPATTHETTTMNHFTGNASAAFFGGEVPAPAPAPGRDLLHYPPARTGSKVTMLLLQAADAALPAS
jgi:hypothetical protein